MSYALQAVQIQTVNVGEVDGGNGMLYHEKAEKQDSSSEGADEVS